MRLKIVNGCYILASLVSLLSPVGSSKCNTSIGGLEILLSAETSLVKYLENYMSKIEMENQHVKDFLVETEADVKYLKKDPLSSYGNPLIAYKVIKRLSIDWRNKGLTILNTDKEVAFRMDVQNLEFFYKKPDIGMLQNAGTNLIHFQESFPNTVQLNTSGLQYRDCFSIGESLFGLKQYKRAMEWFVETRIRLEQEFYAAKSESELPPIAVYYKTLEYMATAMHIIGDDKMTLKYTSDLLALDPKNEFALGIKKKFQRDWESFGTTHKT